MAEIIDFKSKAEKKRQEANEQWNDMLKDAQEGWTFGDFEIAEHELHQPED